MASLLWRLDNHRLALDAGTIVILDEAGMADDPSVLCLLAATETAGSKVVLVGDHLQLGAVGPGGTLEALIARYSHAVHVLDQNVRQVDPDERAALAELRAGNVKTAVDWYRQNDRVVTAPDRDQALDAMVAAWAGDVAGGKEAVMMAWRKTNVAALNARARTAMQTAGELTGPELAVGAGRVFQAGERIVTLAPSAGGEVVTSERGTVTAIDLTSRSLTARMDDGRTQTFGADDLHPDKVGYGYATTVHRCQGATTDVAHLFADGGGRELGYVAMSRARHSTRVHVVADDIEQAGEDLVRDWGHQRRQVWALDTGTPTDAARPEVHPLETELDQTTPAALRATLARARLTAERHALAAAVGDGILADTTPAQHHLAGLDRHIHSLNPATAGVVRTPTSPRTPTRTWAAPAYPVHRAPPAPDRGAGPSL
jgi:ATP-dependent exoDNAse (exonuclease V) alpha subunit